MYAHLRRPVRRLVTVAVAAGCAVALVACGSTAVTNDAATDTTSSSNPSTSVAGDSSAADSSAPESSPADSSPVDAAATGESAASGGAGSLASLLPEDLAKKGVITVVSNIEYPPFESYAADNTTVVGVDRDLADAFEKLFGVKMTFENSSFDAIIPGLIAKRYDMAMSAMSDTVERQKQVDFVDYVEAGGGILFPTANPHGIKTLDDLCGLAVAIDKGTTEVDDATAQSAKCKAEGKPELNSSIYPGQNQMMLALQTGRADAVLVDSVQGAHFAESSDVPLTMLPPYEAGKFGIVFPKGATQLEQAFQKALEQMHSDGTYQKILDKYNLGSIALDDFSINGVTE
jgi:polar amino acid transport system substrate-binding protein